MSQPGIARVLVLYPVARDAERTVTPVGVSTHGAVGWVAGISAAFPALLVRPVSLRGALSFEGGRASISWGTADLANPRDRDSEALASWRALRFPGRRYEQYWADVDRRGRAPRDLADYDLELAGVIDDVRWDAEHQLRVFARDRGAFLERPLDLPKFQGLAECYRLDPGKRIDVDTTGLVLGPDWTLSAWFRHGPGDLALAGQRLVDWGDTAAERGLLLVLNATGDHRIRVLGYGLSTPILDTSPGVLAADLAWHQVHVVRDASARTVTITLDGEPLAVHENVTGDVADLADEPLSFGAGCTCWAIGWQLDAIALSPTTLRATANQPPDVDAESVTAFWGAISPVDQELVSSTGSNHGTAVGLGPDDVVYSGEGWPDAAGLTKPLALGGPIRGVAGFTGDPGRWWVHLGLGPIGGFGEDAGAVAFHRGLPLEVGGQVTEDPVAGLVRVHSLIGGDPGQWRFHFDGLLVDGQVERNAGALVEHVGTTFAGLEPGDFDGDALRAAIPYDVAYRVAAGQATTLGELATALMASNNAIAFFARDDRLTAARIVLDSPTVTLRQGPDLLWAEDLGEAIPTTGQTVLYDRNWDPQDDDDLAATTSEEHRAFATRPHRCADWRGDAEIAEDYPTAVDGAPLETFLVHRRDAWRVGEERQEGLWAPGVHRVRLVFARRPVDADGQVLADLGATVRVHASDLATPPDGRVYKVVRLSSDEGPFGMAECLGIHDG